MRSYFKEFCKNFKEVNATSEEQIVISKTMENLRAMEGNNNSQA